MSLAVTLEIKCIIQAIFALPQQVRTLFLIIDKDLNMATSALNLSFVNNTTLADSDVYITFQNPATGSTNFNVTYGASTPISIAKGNIMSTSVSLKDIGSSGLTVTQASGVVVFVSYGAPLTATTSVPSYIGSGGPDYNTPFQPFELTRVGGNGDQGNMTAINYFTAPMSITSYSSATPPVQLQSTSFTQTAQQIGSSIAALTNSNAQSVIKNSSGKIVRYIGPSSYGPTDSNPFSSLLPYLQAVNAANQTTAIQNNNAFNQPAAAGPGSTNYNFTLNLTAGMGTDGSITMSGSISTTVIPYGGASAAGPTFDNATVTISAANSNALNFVLYGQALDTDVVSFGSGWTKLEAYMKKIGLDTQGALDTTKNLAIGEITTGLLMGLVNSAVIPSGGTVAIKDMASKAWWALNPTVAFSQAQTDSADYNQYANVIYLASGNGAYSIPYSDRLGSGPLVNSVNYNGTDVGSWVVTLDPPVSVSSGS